VVAKAVELEIAVIRRNGETQGRAAVDDSIIEEYARLMKKGVV